MMAAIRDQIRSTFPPLERILELFKSDRQRVESFPLPHDLADGFAGAAWRAPERYLDQDFRDGTSAFRQLEPALTEKGLSALRHDLENGEWDSRYGEVREREHYDMGYAFVVREG